VFLCPIPAPWKLRLPIRVIRGNVFSQCLNRRKGKPRNTKSFSWVSRVSWRRSCLRLCHAIRRHGSRWLNTFDQPVLVQGARKTSISRRKLMSPSPRQMIVAMVRIMGNLLILHWTRRQPFALPWPGNDTTDWMRNHGGMRAGGSFGKFILRRVLSNLGSGRIGRKRT
jgi:hypothetical protein